MLKTVVKVLFGVVVAGSLMLMLLGTRQQIILSFKPLPQFVGEVVFIAILFISWKITHWINNMR